MKNYNELDPFVQEFMKELYHLCFKYDMEICSEGGYPVSIVWRRPYDHLINDHYHGLSPDCKVTFYTLHRQSILGKTGNTTINPYTWEEAAKVYEKENQQEIGHLLKKKMLNQKTQELTSIKANQLSNQKRMAELEKEIEKLQKILGSEENNK